MSCSQFAYLKEKMMKINEEKGIIINIYEVEKKAIKVVKQTRAC